MSEDTKNQKLEDQVIADTDSVELEDSNLDDSQEDDFQEDDFQEDDSQEESSREEPLYEELKARGKENQELKATIQHMRKLMDKQQEYAYNQALKDLKAAKLNAIESGDAYAVQQAEEEMQKLNQDQQSLKQEPVTPKVQAFIDKSQSWLNDNSPDAQDMKLMAEAKYVSLKQQGWSDDSIVDEVEASLQRSFPHRFGGARARIPKVEKSSPDASSSKKVSKTSSFNDLTAEQKEACRYFEQRGVMSKKEYIEELKKIGELK